MYTIELYKELLCYCVEAFYHENPGTSLSSDDIYDDLYNEIVNAMRSDSDFLISYRGRYRLIFNPKCSRIDKKDVAKDRTLTTDPRIVEINAKIRRSCERYIARNLLDMGWEIIKHNEEQIVFYKPHIGMVYSLRGIVYTLRSNKTKEEMKKLFNRDLGDPMSVVSGVRRANIIEMLDKPK